MNRSLSFGLIFLCVCGRLFAQEKDSKESIQSNAEAQFDQLDNDGDGMLSEDELEGFSQKILGRMREQGLRRGYPLPRDEFVKAAVSQMEAGEKKDRAKDEEPRQRKELKHDEPSSSSTPESTTSSPTGTRRGSSGKSRFAPSLPPEYLARDKNGDGQIGLYEWDRAKYAEFAKLDKNGDGFLTAAELLSKSVVKVGGPLVGGKTAEIQDSIDEEARKSFTRMDANSDGGLAEDEWAASKRVRPMFENAGINASLPMDSKTFVVHYLKAKAHEASANNGGQR